MNTDVKTGADERKVMLNFNGIIVIQSLSDNERQTGSELYNDIIKRSCEQKKLYSQFMDVNSRAEINACFLAIHDACKSGKFYPLIHFEIHGSKEGFVLKNGELVTWQEVAELCRVINIPIKNQLVVSLATCLGAYITLGIDIQKESPFWAFIGPKDLITQEDVIEDFSNLFEELLVSYDIKMALNRLDLNQSRTKYAYLPAQVIFEEYLEKRFLGKPFDKVEKFKSVMKNSKQHFPQLDRRQRRSLLRKRINTLDRDKLILQMKKRFLMDRVG